MNKQKINKNLYFVLPVISILFVVGLVVALVQPKVVSIDETKNKIKTEEGKKAILDAKIIQLRTLAEQKSELVAQLAAARVALPDQKDIPGLIIQVEKIAQESDVIITGEQLNPGKLVVDSVAPTKTGPDISISVAVKGNSESIKTFLGKIYKAKRLLNMESITVNSGGANQDEGEQTVSITMYAYYQPNPPKPKDETEPIPALTPDEIKTYETLKGYTSYSEDQAVEQEVEQPAASASADVGPIQ